MEGSNRENRFSDSDSAVVDGVLRDLEDAAQRWAAVLAEAERVSFAVDLGDVRAVTNADGRLISLTLHPSVTTGYTRAELSGRLNSAFEALRDEVIADFQVRYGTELR